MELRQPELQRLLDVAGAWIVQHHQDRDGRLSDDDARELAASLERHAGDDLEAAAAAGSIALQLYLAEPDFPDVEGLDRALRLFAGLPPALMPGLVRDVFTADLPPDLEPGRPGVPCHPGHLLIAAYQICEGLDRDHSIEDFAALRVAGGLSRLAIEYALPDGALIASMLADYGDYLQKMVGLNHQGDLIPELLDVRRASLAKARPDEELIDRITENLRGALMLMYSYEPDEALLAELGMGAVEVAEHMRDHVRLLLRFGPVDYETIAIGQAATSVYVNAGGTDTEAFWDAPGKPGSLDTATFLPKGVTDVAGEGEPPLRVMNINIGEDIGDRIREEIAALPRRARGRRAELHAELANHYRRRFHDRGDREFLDTAVEQAGEAVRLCPRRDPQRGYCLLADFRARLGRLVADGDPADLDAVIDRLREYLALGEDLEPEAEARYRADLASHLARRYVHDDRRVRDLEDAIALAGRAVRLAPAGLPVAYLARSGLGVATALAATHGIAAGAGLDAAIELLREGAGIPVTDENHSTVHNNLSNILVSRYYRGGSVADLDEAVAAARAAWDGVEVEHWQPRYESLHTLGEALGLRYRELGALSDLDDTVALAREVVGRLPDGHPFVAVARSVLARQLATRAGRTGSPAELAEAVRLARVALDEAGEPRVERYARWGLATVLATATGSPDERARLREAVEIRRGLPPGHSGRVELAGLLRRLFLLSPPQRPEYEHSREAEQLLRGVRRTSLDKTELHLDLGELLFERAFRDGNRATMLEASRFLRAAARRPGTAPVERMTAARGWGAALAARGEWAQSAAAYREAVGLLPQLAPRTLVRADQEHRLSHAADLASDACAAALRAGDPDAALRALEAGRGVLWARLMRADADLAGLAGRPPELAERYARLRDALDEPYTREPLSAESAGLLAERRRRLGEQWQELMGELPGGDAPAGVSEVDITHPGVPGTVVLLAPSVHGSHALLLSPGDGVEPVPLPVATPGAAADAADRVRRALLDLQDPATGLSGRRRAEDDILAVLDWLWGAVTGPVLDRLDRAAPGGGPHRVWWVPAGPLAALPIHAAGDALSRARSSFSPTLQALRGARPAGPSAPPRMLLVAMPETPGAAPLPGARDEADELRRGRGPVELVGPTATRAAVLDALAGCEIAHFACHSVADPQLPGATRLLLHDHDARPLTLHDIARLRLPGAWLSYLSSCATMLSGRGLADEAVHLAAAFRHAGFAHVVGTLWPVDDRRAALPVARDFYAELDTAGPAEALRRAAAALAAAEPRHPSFWAGHVHVGT